VKQPEVLQSDWKEHVSIMTAIRADGKAFAPMFIFKGTEGVRLKKHYLQGIDEQYTALAAQTGAFPRIPSRVSPFALTCQSVRSLRRVCLHDEGHHGYVVQGVLGWHQPHRRSAILLILDNHTSRFDVEFLDLALQNHVHVLLLPPNLTHLLQPADVGVFSSLKTRVHKACLNFTVAGGSINKLNVAGLVFPSWLACISPTTSNRAFANPACGPSIASPCRTPS
jgi:hypothetical protein